MFYSHNILTKKGKLGIIWLAATYKGQKNKYLNSRDFKKVNIIKACQYIINPTLPFALRLSSTLMVGVVRVYNEQTRIILIEANEMMKAVKAAIIEQRLSNQLQMKNPEQRQEAITLPLLIDYDIDFPECQEQIHTDYLVSFAKSDKYFYLPKVKSPEIQLPISPGLSPEQKISTEEEKSPHQADRKDITIAETDYTTIQDEEIKIPGEIDIVEPLPLDDIDLFDKPEDKRDDIGLSPLKASEVPGEEAEVMLFDEQTGALKQDATPPQEAQLLATPQQARVEPVQPDRPRRRRRLAIDFTIKLKDDAMRKNLRNADSLKKRKICDISDRPTLRDLFTSPATSVVCEEPLRHLWERNAKVRRLADDETQWVVDVASAAVHASPIHSILEELSSGLDESPTSGIEMLRAASHASMEFEQSAGDITPEVSTLDKSRRSRDSSLGGDKRVDVSFGTPRRPASRLSTADRQSFLSPIVDRDEELLEIDLPLGDIEEHLSMDESGEVRVTDDGSLEALRTIKHAMGQDSKINFSTLVPYSTLRKHTAKVFYHIIALTNIGALYLTQHRPYEEIVIGRGREF